MSPQNDPYAAIAEPTQSADPYAAIAERPGTPPPPPGYWKTFAQESGIPTSMEELKAMPGALIKGPYEYGKRVVGNFQEANKEASEAGENVAGGQPLGKNLGKMGYAGLKATLNSMPFVGPATQRAGEEIAQKNYAGGAGALSAAILQAIQLKGKSPARTKLGKLTYATGETGETARALEKVMPDIAETVKAQGKPSTIGDFHQVVKKTTSRLDQKFNRALFSNAHRQVVPMQIAQDLLNKAAEMPPSADGQAIAQQLRNAATEYQRPWTLRELNAERGLRNGYLKGFYGKTGSAQSAAMRSSAESIIDKIVVDGTKDTLYGELDRLNPGADFQSLKMKQSYMKTLQDQLDQQTGKLEDAQLAGEGKPFMAKHSVTASAHTGGITPRFHNVMGMLQGGPEEGANKAVKGAFKSQLPTNARRAAILALPVTRLHETVPPPPGASDEDSGPQN